MSHIQGSQDADLHQEDGEHRSTARSASGRQVELHERRIAEHLRRHGELVDPEGDPALAVRARPVVNVELPADSGL